MSTIGEFPRAVASLFVAVTLSGLAVLLYLGGEGSVFSYLAAIPALLAVLMALNSIHSLFAAKTPPTNVVMSEEPLKRGAAVAIVIRQPGPVRFHSLRASLVCERIRKRAGRSREVTYPYQRNFFDSGQCDIARFDIREFRATVQVPEDAEPSREAPDLLVLWRIEVWGKVAGGADFMRPFDVEVV